MKYALLFALGLATASCACTQESGKTTVMYQSAGSVASGSAVATIASGRVFGTPVQGAPYSATITNESIQTLADGNRIVQNSNGSTARDSQGRTRQDAALPAIGNLSVANPPHIVFILDPVAQVSYTLNLTDKTAQKISAPPTGPNGSSTTTGGKVFITQFATATAGSAPPVPIPPPPGVGIVRAFGVEEHADARTEDLGTQTIEGLLVTGTRTTHTIPTGEIGNEKPITIVTEVWTSPDLQTVVYSKRTDPRMGEQTFKLANVVRGEPDSSLFTVPADFKVIDGPQNVIYRTNP